MTIVDTIQAAHVVIVPKHKHHWLAFWYHDGCALCKIRQLLYGFRMDPEGYNKALEDVKYDTRFTRYERVYILNRFVKLEIDYD